MKRFDQDMDGSMEPREDGDWYRAADVEAMLERVEALLVRNPEDVYTAQRRAIVDEIRALLGKESP